MIKIIIKHQKVFGRELFMVSVLTIIARVGPVLTVLGVIGCILSIFMINELLTEEDTNGAKPNE